MFARSTFALFALVASVAASPVAVTRRDVYVPPIITPDSTTVWKIGFLEQVTWYAASHLSRISFRDPYVLGL